MKIFKMTFLSFFTFQSTLCPKSGFLSLSVCMEMYEYVINFQLHCWTDNYEILKLDIFTKNQESDDGDFIIQIRSTK